MRKFLLNAALAAALLPVASSVTQAAEAPPFGATTVDPRAATAGTYSVDPTHATVLAQVKHLGFSTTYIRFDGLSGSITYDPKSPATSTANITIDAKGLESGFALRNEHLRGEAWFNVAAHPNILFKSSKLIVTGKRTARLSGELTMLGVTKPVSLNVTFNGYGMGMDKAPRVGLTASTTIRRSDFGMKTFMGPVSDEVRIEIEAEFSKK
ncbi:polyisoprenoid-binding protein [Novosphingobium sp. FSY-8]|uniref:Polyisoprenoid-binding protein n=1 Tax=Novosphingobium ovatum TaxID=1908523 RepID=A0ABW9XI03_9SPHN|nr:YceI family protein [Novosphingobium ovatum]NBC38184.1 polyisoprenoid-binding protein [Novosphingobium ovatum]